MGWKEELYTQGYTVIPTLTPEEVALGLGYFQDWLQHNPITIPPHGVIKHYNIGHTGFAWWVRTRPSVLSTFQELWGDQDLIVSFDGVCYFPKGLQRRNTYWLHVDQAPSCPHFSCVQGFVCFTENDFAGLEIVPHSHLMFQQYMASHQIKHTTPWQKISDPYETTLVPTKPGDLVLWDSRCFHQNRYSSSEERLVQYVCYLPRNRLTPAQAVKRRKYFDEKRTTSHWPTPIRVNSLQPQVFGKTDLLIDYSKIRDPHSYLLDSLANEIHSLL